MIKRLYLKTLLFIDSCLLFNNPEGGYPIPNLPIGILAWMNIILIIINL